MIQFCSITTLPLKLRKHIYNEMSWENGLMQYYLRYNLPKCKLALKFIKGHLVCWVLMCFLDYELDGRPFIGVWTAKDCRCRGYAQETISSLLHHMDILNTEEINVYRDSTYRILNRIGYIPIRQQWNHEWLKTWLQKNFSDRSSANVDI